MGSRQNRAVARGDFFGKKVVELKYRLNDADVVIPVRLVQDTTKVEHSKAPWKGKGSKPTHTAGCVFRVYYEEIGLPGSPEGEPDYVESTDIEVLRSVVMEKLDEKHEIKWEHWFLVSVRDSYVHGLNGIGVDFEWSRVWIAHLPDGRTVHRLREYRGDKIEDGLPPTGTRDLGRTSMVSLVPATDENTAALENFKDRIEALRTKMKDFMSPEKIGENIKMLGRLLPPPPPKEEKKKGKKG
jgi:hypothetical protein